MSRSLTALFLWACSLMQAQSPALPRLHPSNFKVLSYRLEVRFDWDDRAVVGDETVTIKALTPLRQVELDAGDMRVISVSTSRGVALHFEHSRERLIIDLANNEVAQRPFALRIVYRAHPRRGLKFIPAGEGGPKSGRQIYTAGQPEKNHFWFPCVDSPGMFSKFEVIATVETPLRVISNGRLLGATRNRANRTVTYHWRQDQPIPAYLVSIVAAEFDEVRHTSPGVPVLSYVPPGRSAEGKAVLGETPGMMKFFASQLGIPYPFAKYSQALVANFPGGLENTSATTLGDAILYPARMRDEESRGAELLIAHELAHQWFGSLVGPSDWADIWLNESLATYFAHLYQEHKRGLSALQGGVWEAQRSSLSSAKNGNLRPLSTHSYSDPDELFDEVIYSRGAAVLHMLRFVLGDAAWWKSMHHYLDSNKNGVVDTARFQAAVERASGSDLKWFFDEWVYNAGIPEFEVNSSYDKDSRELEVVVDQKGALFQTPVDICLVTAAAKRVERVWIRQKRERFRFASAANPSYITFDCGGNLLETVRTNKTLEQLVTQARGDPSVADRLSAIAEIGSAARNSSFPDALESILARDPSVVARLEAVKAIASYDGPRAQDALFTGLADNSPEIRRAALRALTTHPSDRLTKEAFRLLRNDSSDRVAAEAVRCLGQARDAEARVAVWSALARESRRDVVRVAALTALAQPVSGDSVGFAKVSLYSRLPHPPAVRSAALLAAIKLAPNNATVRDELFAMSREALFSPGPLKLAAARALAELRDPRGVALLEEFLRDDPNPGPFDLAFRTEARKALQAMAATPLASQQPGNR